MVYYALEEHDGASIWVVRVSHLLASVYAMPCTKIVFGDRLSELFSISRGLESTISRIRVPSSKQ